ncbi:hypothetical protein [Nostoc sp.]|uniref:hypothetical protein n=1 Tax=Nostoc sp. TaxID=1180 RepID=UPI002FFB2CF3
MAYSVLRPVLVVYQIHFDRCRDAINRRLYKDFIHQLFIERLLVVYRINFAGLRDPRLIKEVGDLNTLTFQK